MSSEHEFQYAYQILKIQQKVTPKIFNSNILHIDLLLILTLKLLLFFDPINKKCDLS